jgi:hypothetical protein
VNQFTDKVETSWFHSDKIESGQRIIAKIQSAVAPAALLSLWLKLDIPDLSVEPLLHVQRHFIVRGILTSIQFGEPDMPTAIRVSTPISTSASSKKSDYGQFVSIALFSAIGLFVSLMAVLLGVQGAWY